MQAVGVSEGYYLFYASPYVLTLLVMVMTVSPGKQLTGAPAQIAAVAKAYRVYFQKAGKGDGYSVDHTSIIYLMNPQGKFDRPITETQTPAAIAAQIGQAMQAAAG